MPVVTPLVPDAAPAALPPEPWFKFPDRKVWAGGVGGLIAYTLFAVLKKYTGFDINVLVGLLPGVDIQGYIALAIGGLIAQFVPPSLKDIVSRVNNAVVKLANADMSNTTTAKIVTGEESDKEAKKDIANGIIPNEVVAKRFDIVGEPPK